MGVVNYQGKKATAETEEKLTENSNESPQEETQDYKCHKSYHQCHKNLGEIRNCSKCIRKEVIIIFVDQRFNFVEENFTYSVYKCNYVLK